MAPIPIDTSAPCGLYITPRAQSIWVISAHRSDDKLSATDKVAINLSAAPRLPQFAYFKLAATSSVKGYYLGCPKFTQSHHTICRTSGDLVGVIFIKNGVVYLVANDSLGQPKHLVYGFSPGLRNKGPILLDNWGLALRNGSNFPVFHTVGQLYPQPYAHLARFR